MADNILSAPEVPGQLLAPAPPAQMCADPPLSTLRSMSSDLERTTEFGSPAYVSETRSRSANQTKTTVDDEFTEEDWALVEKGIETVLDEPESFVCVDRMVGRHPEEALSCRLIVPRHYGRIALAWAKLLDPAPDGAPDLLTIQLPDTAELAIRVVPEAGLTVVHGSDYTGEAKKSFLRLFMHRAKRRGGLGLHAGSKRVTLEDDDGTRRTIGQVFLGLSGTGKTTLTGHGFWLEDPEQAMMLQDDVCALRPDGVVAGSEGGGLYIKTIGLSPAEQPELYNAATHESAVLENVDVEEDGIVDFDSDRYTRNGRAVVDRDQLPCAASDIDLEEVDQLFFITRNPLMPPIAKLSDRQAAAAFMLGESVQTSAGDPDAAGESIRVVGTNPFIMGSRGEEGNRFHDLIAEVGATAFLLNTGSIGEEGPSIEVEDTISLIVATARDRIEWTDAEFMDLEIPETVPGMDIGRYDVPEHVEDFERRYEALREERRAYLESFPDLRQSIRESVY
ncbi:MAG: phosphoenolpyruvate carboxykinase (ATP) [Halodesulfurarchaeum sp.]